MNALELLEGWKRAKDRRIDRDRKVQDEIHISNN